MLPLVRLSRLCAVSALVLLPLGGCLLDTDPPPNNPTKPASCGNGTCDTNTEDCSNCPEDCDCCAVVNAEGIIGNQPAMNFPAAVGQPDSQSISLGPDDEVRLSLGGPWFDRPQKDGEAQLHDLRIHGTVSTSSTPYTGCPQKAIGTGAFEVWAADATGAWVLIGLWTSQATSFDFGCGKNLKSVRRLKIRGQQGASGQLDAITPLTGACLQLGTP